MQLWNDYEGKTLAGAFPVEALLSTGGRNAFFRTHGRDGRPAVLRLTEALNDQEEMRARYSAIRSVEQPNLVRIKDFGDAELEGTPLIYVVMEATEENLSEIIGERCLSVDETAEVALSLVSALEALHAHGLVHGVVEPASVVAAGTVVKLRSDCVRPAPEGLEGEQARAEDVFGLADVLNQCLTQKHLQEASDALALPEPYASIARNVVRGNWGLTQVAAELRRMLPPASQPTRQPTRQPATQPATPPLLQPASQPSIQPATQPIIRPAAAQTASASSPAETSGPALPPPVEELALPTTLGRSEKVAHRSNATGSAQLPLVYTPARETEQPAAGAERKAEGGWQKPATREFPPALLAAGLVGACLLLLLIWHFGRHSNHAGAGGAKVAAPAVTPVTASSPSSIASSSIAPSSIASAASGPRAAAPIKAEARTAPARDAVWRVVAYTYNAEAQAKSKAHAIAERHSDLHPQVFSRTGRAPYLVVLGGSLTRAQAAAMLHHAHEEGLARDIYTQNYSH